MNKIYKCDYTPDGYRVNFGKKNTNGNTKKYKVESEVMKTRHKIQTNTKSNPK